MSNIFKIELFIIIINLKLYFLKKNNVLEEESFFMFQYL